MACVSSVLLIEFLTGPQAAPLWKAKGFEPG